MKYRVKLYLAFLFVTVVSVLLALGIAYYNNRKELFLQHRSKVKSVAATSAPFINGDLVQGLGSKEQINTDAYKEVFDKLIQIRDTNRRKDLYVKYVYLLRPVDTSPPKFEIIADAENLPQNKSYVGTYITEEESGGLSNHLGKTYSPPGFVEDSWGTFLYGYAPIYNSRGKYVATLGVDIYAQDITKHLNYLIYSGLIAVGTAVVLAIILASVLSKQASYALGELCNAVHEIDQGNFSHQLEVETNDEFSNLAMDVNKMAIGLKEREWLKANFSRYVSNHVMEKILHSEHAAKLEGERRKITVLFSDIRQFTQISEKMEPEEIVSLLNEYFGQMLEVIFANSGTLDKFIGDGIMVEFGSPLEDPSQEKHAVLTAIEMQEAMENLCEKWKNEGKDPLKMGVGVHTGEAVVGNIGSDRRMEYTAIGDTVNVAAGLEKENKRFSSSIIVSQATYEAIKNEFDFKSLGDINLPGREAKITIYTLASMKKPRNHEV